MWRNLQVILWLQKPLKQNTNNNKNDNNNNNNNKSNNDNNEYLYRRALLSKGSCLK